jgi:hypothetical protein
VQKDFFFFFFFFVFLSSSSSSSAPAAVSQTHRRSSLMIGKKSRLLRLEDVVELKGRTVEGNKQIHRSVCRLNPKQRGRGK